MLAALLGAGDAASHDGYRPQGVEGCQPPLQSIRLAGMPWVWHGGDTLRAERNGQVPPLRHDAWFAKDKADHLIASAFLVGLGYYTARKELNYSDPGSKNIGAGFSFSLGLLKELRDQRRRNNFFSLKDLGADILGIALGYLLCSAGDD